MADKEIKGVVKGQSIKPEEDEEESKEEHVETKKPVV